ncbi:MAG: hypothetical protein EAZ91_18980 [Cytophagales bacterium]|nr:MAG: hypothetical protein EAZ91_18980 [Cytophagales bacterium]
MKYLFVCIVGLGLLLGCKKEEAVDPALVDRKTPGEWSAAQVGAGGFGNADSFKNFQYTFEVGGANQVVSLTLTSATMDVQYALFNPLGQQIDISTKGRSVTKPYTLNAGKHRLVVMADRQAVGTFTLNTVGLNADPVRIESPVLQSGSQSWGPLGGGGRARTLKNHFYTFDVTDDNSTADIELFSAETDIAFTLYDALGQEVETTTGGRYQFLLKAVKKGTYTVMAATNVRAAVGNYQLNVFGKVANLKRVESQVVQSGIQTWGPLGGGGNVRTFKNHFYTVEVTEDNTPIDFALESANVDVKMVIYNPLGQIIASDFFNSRYEFKILDLKKGTYTVMAATNVRAAVGNYQLNIFGKVANLKRIESQVVQSGIQSWGPLGGGGGARTFKNHLYTVEVTEDNTPIDFAVESADVDVEMVIYNPLGQTIASDFFNSRNRFKVIILTKGTYTVMAATSMRGAVGNYQLNIFGKVANLKRVESQMLQSGTQDWGPLGGGGAVKSTKNHFYSFEVTEENSIVDLEIESADTETCLFLYNNLDVAITQQQGSRYLFRIIATRKGTYTVMAGTLSRGDAGKYSLRIFGKVANLQRIPSVSANAQGNWPTGRSFDTYSIQITDNNAPLDIDLSSPDTRVAIYLQNSGGTKVDQTYFPYKSIALPVENLPRGTYRIVVQTHNPIFDPGGSYSINLFGRFTDFKKL